MSRFVPSRAPSLIFGELVEGGLFEDGLVFSDRNLIEHDELLVSLLMLTDIALHVRAWLLVYDDGLLNDSLDYLRASILQLLN